MKKNISIFFALGLIALASCQKEQIASGPIQDSATYSIPVSVAVSSGQTKAYYGEKESSAYKIIWENSDQILALKGKAQAPSSVGTQTDNGCPLSIAEVKETTADFAGEVTSSYTGNAVWHYLFPASAATLYTSNSRASGIMGAVMYSQKLAASLEIPEIQNGLWTPFAYTRTEGKISDEEIVSLDFTVFNSCLAFRSFDTDGVTPKKLKTIVLQAGAGQALAGKFEAISENLNSNSADPDKVNIDASSFDFKGESSVLTCQVEGIAPDSNGNYEYRVNIPGGLTLGEISLRLIDDADNEMLATVPANENVLAAGVKRNYALKWKSAPVLDLTVDFAITAEPKSSYSYYAGKNGVTEPDLAKANSAEFIANPMFVEDGAYTIGVTCSKAVEISECGYYIGNQKYQAVVDDPSAVSFSGALKVDALDEVGSYTIECCAYVIAEGREYRSEEKSFTIDVTGLPYDFSFRVKGVTDNTSGVQDAGWSCYGNTGSMSNQFFLCSNGSQGYAVTPAFFMPADVNVSVELKHRYYIASISTSGKNMLVYVEPGSSNNFKAAANQISVAATNKTGETGDLKTHTWDFTLTPENNYVGIANNGASSGMSSFYYIHNFKMIYR